MGQFPSSMVKMDQLLNQLWLKRLNITVSLRRNGAPCKISPRWVSLIIRNQPKTIWEELVNDLNRENRPQFQRVLFGFSAKWIGQGSCSIKKRMNRAMYFEMLS